MSGTMSGSRPQTQLQPQGFSWRRDSGRIDTIAGQKMRWFLITASVL
jgi:hypothetical protein